MFIPMALLALGLDDESDESEALKQERERAIQRRREKSRPDRYCPKNPDHLSGYGKYCEVCKARIRK